jgi:hypothetical protein
MNKLDNKPSGCALLDQQTLGQVVDAAIEGIDQALADLRIQELHREQAIYGVVAGIAAEVVSRGGRLPVEECDMNIVSLCRQMVKIVHNRTATREKGPVPNDCGNTALPIDKQSPENRPALSTDPRKHTEVTRGAFLAGRDAIVTKLGKNATKEDIADVIQLMAHHVLTENGTLGLPVANHNTTVFCEILRAMVERSQGGNSSDYGRMLM